MSQVLMSQTQHLVGPTNPMLCDVFAASEAAASSQQPAASAANGTSAAPSTDAAEPAAKRQKVGESADEEDAGGIREGQV